MASSGSPGEAAQSTNIVHSDVGTPPSMPSLVSSDDDYVWPPLDNSDDDSDLQRELNEQPEFYAGGANLRNAIANLGAREAAVQDAEQPEFLQVSLSVFSTLVASEDSGCKNSGSNLLQVACDQAQRGC